jgi:hypothetical protein
LRQIPSDVLAREQSRQTNPGFAPFGGVELAPPPGLYLNAKPADGRPEGQRVSHLIVPHPIRPPPFGAVVKDEKTGMLEGGADARRPGGVRGW